MGRILDFFLPSAELKWRGRLRVASCVRLDAFLLRLAQSERLDYDRFV